MDPLAILDNYVVTSAGRADMPTFHALVRRNLDGTVQGVHTLNGSKAVTMFRGRRYFANEIAWLCHHRFPCPYPIVNLNGNPFDMAPDNLMPVVRKRLIFRLTKKGNGYYHPLNKVGFTNEITAKHDWLKYARAYYSSDYDAVLSAPANIALAAQISDDLLKEMEKARKARQRPWKLRKQDRPVKRPPVPDVPEGMECHWYKDQWVVIPKAVHCSDDWMVRAEACLKNPQARFRYDPVLERTVTVDA